MRTNINILVYIIINNIFLYLYEQNNYVNVCFKRNLFTVHFLNHISNNTAKICKYLSDSNCAHYIFSTDLSLYYLYSE